MKNKKGISLIVLVITIIVMIILAAAIIVSLNNNNIIGKSKEAVDKTNLKQVQELAQTIWAEAYLDGARTQQELYEAVMEGLKEAKVDTSKYTIIVTTSGATVTIQAMNEYGFYFDRLYVADMPEGSTTTREGYVLHADGTVEYYAATSYTNNVLYCMGAMSSGVTYSQKKVTYLPSGSTEAEVTTFSEDGLTATYGDLTLTCSTETLHGIYLDRNYSAEYNDVKIVAKFNSDNTATLTEGTTTQTATSYTLRGDNHIVVSGTSRGYISADGTSMISSLTSGPILKLESANNSEDEITTNEWVVAWVYKDDTWSSRIEKGGTLEGDFVAKLYPTGKKVTPTSEEDVAAQVIELLKLTEGDAYKLVIEGSGNIPSVIQGGESFAWQSEGLTDVFANKTEFENNYPFYITEIEIKEGITGICNSAFGCFVSLEEIVLPTSLTKVEGNTFSKCTSLKEIELSDSIIEIGEAVFLDCINLKSARLPNSIKDIPFSTFGGCKSLESVAFSSDLETIGTRAFWFCASLKNITIPDTVTSIGEGAFQECNSLTTVTIPASVVNMGNVVFQYCENLTTVIFNNNDLETIPESMFFKCPKLANVTLPTKLKKISSWAFQECTNLVAIDLPSTLSTIERETFMDCTSLKTVTIRATSTYTVEKNAFMNIASNSTIYVTSSATKECFTAGTNYDSSLTTITIK